MKQFNMQLYFSSPWPKRELYVEECIDNLRYIGWQLLGSNCQTTEKIGTIELEDPCGL